ncbi:hypothetical protein D9M71_747570 [compost metagenome]
MLLHVVDDQLGDGWRLQFRVVEDCPDRLHDMARLRDQIVLMGHLPILVERALAAGPGISTILDEQGIRVLDLHLPHRAEGQAIFHLSGVHLKLPELSR